MTSYNSNSEGLALLRFDNTSIVELGVVKLISLRLNLFNNISVLGRLKVPVLKKIKERLKVK